jgi:CRISPR/Cas system CSM-associated protein Csm2 small subunit
MYEENFPDSTEWKSKFIRAMEIIRYLFPEIKETRWHNRSDYYSLFVATSHRINDYVFSDNNMKVLSRHLRSFGEKVDEAVKKEGKSKDKIVTSYAKAVIAGASDRDRRLIRHEILSRIIEKHIPKKRKN